MSKALFVIFFLICGGIQVRVQNAEHSCNSQIQTQNKLFIETIKSNFDKMLDETKNLKKEFIEIDLNSLDKNIFLDRYNQNPADCHLHLDKIIIQRHNSQISLVVTQMPGEQTGNTTNVQTINQAGNQTGNTTDVQISNQTDNQTINQADNQTGNRNIDDIIDYFTAHIHEEDFFKSENISIKTINDNQSKIIIKTNLRYYVPEIFSPMITTTICTLLAYPCSLLNVSYLNDFLVNLIKPEDKFKDIILNFLNNKVEIFTILLCLIPFLPFIVQSLFWLFSYTGRNLLIDTYREIKHKIKIGIKSIGLLWRNSKKHERIILISQIGLHFLLLPLLSCFIFRYSNDPLLNITLFLSVLYSNWKNKNLIKNIYNDCEGKVLTIRELQYCEKFLYNQTEA